MQKQKTEMTKGEIFKEIRFNNRALKKMGLTEVVVDWITFFVYADSNRELRTELKNRGRLSINDKRIIDCSGNIEWLARKRIEKLLGE